MSAPALSSTDRESLLWLALPPLWTGMAALRTGFPVPGQTSSADRATALIRFVDQAVAAATAVCRGGMTAARFPYATFWLTDAARGSILTEAIRQRGHRPVLALAQRIANELRELDGDYLVPPVVQDWIALVTGELQVANRVLELCHDDRVEAAMRLVTAAEVYLPIAAPDLADQVAAAHRQVTLANRHSHDLEQLRNFQKRGEWTEEVEQLLAGGDQWALHLRGHGGTGKTTFIRYLASGRYAADHGRRVLPMARVDFDHLNPEYPLRRPVQLLIEFAEELAPYAAESGDGAAALDAFVSIAKSAEATGSEAAGPGATKDHLVRQATKAFARFIAALPQPVLLILDTCEELPRRALDDDTNPAVQALFDRLWQMREVSDVRVLFSGRRSLAMHDPGLKVVPARGFREEEAVALLKRPYGGKIMSAKLIRAVLELSPEHAPSGAARKREVRYSPYEVTTYWRWWTVDTSIKPADFRRNHRSDYIEARIVPRLGQQLRRWLTAVALLGRFDVRMLAPARPVDVDVDDVIREFARMEWTAMGTDPASLSPIVEVDRPLRPHLLAWARESDPRRFGETRARLAGALADDLKTRPLGQISTAHVISALRLAGPEAALYVWEAIEHRVAREDGWPWLASVGPRVLGAIDETPDDHEDGVAGNRPLSAAVRGAATGVARRDDPGHDLATAWLRVTAELGDATHPVAERLRWRSRLARARYAGAPATAEEVNELARLITDARPDGSLAAGVVALVETLAESRPPAIDLSPIAQAARTWVTLSEDPVVRAAFRVYLGLLARPESEDEPKTLPAEDISPGHAAADAQSARPGDGNWTDWTPPSHCAAWVSLHAARDAFLAGRPLESLPLVEWERQAEGALHLIDGERLLSQCLRLRMGYGVVPSDRLDAILARDQYDPARVATRAVHRQVPPLFASLSEAYLTAGSAEVALRILRDRRSAAAADRQHRRALEEADRALVRLTRALRDPRIASVFRYRTVPNDEIFRAEVWATNALVDGSRTKDWGDGKDLRRWHDCWQAAAVDVRIGQVGLPVVPSLPGPGTPANLKSFLIADGIEMRACGLAVTGLAVWAKGWSHRPLPVDRGDTTWPLAALQVWLATASEKALIGPRDIKAPLNAPLHEATFALRQGELRALRDPAGALPLLDFAVEQSGRRSPVLTLQAATVRALAVLHLPGEPDQNRRAGAALALADAYDEFRSHVVPPPPSWQEVADTDRPLPGPWSGWLARVRVAAQGLVPPAADLAPRVHPQGRLDVPVELWGHSFGHLRPEVVVPEANSEPDGSVLVRSLTSLGTWLRAGTLRMTAYARGERSGAPRVTLEVDDGAHALLVSHDHLAPHGAAEVPPARVPVPWPGEDPQHLPDELFARLRDKPYAVGRLRLPPRLSSLAWEEHLESPLRRRPGEPHTAWYREWPGAPAPRPHDWRPGRVDVIPADRGRRMAEESYAARPGLDARLILDRTHARSDQPVSVLHAVGRPVFDPTGPLLQTAEIAGPRTQSFVSSDDLAAYRAHFVVVQGLPHRGSLRIDPFEASVARQFAVDAMVAGARSLLLVPALPYELAGKVFGMIRDTAMRSTMPNHAQRVDLIRQIHDRITGYFRPTSASPGSKSARAEMFQVLGQVILFLPASEVGVEQLDEVVPLDVNE